MIRSSLYGLYRTTRFYAGALVGRVEPHKDHPVIWTISFAFRRAWRRAARGAPSPAVRRRLLGRDPPPLQRPIFMVSTIRAGSSIAAVCLDQHPRIQFVGFELSLHWSRLAEIEIGGQGAAGSCPPLGERDALPARSERVRREFARLHARGRKGPRARFLNKNPHLWNKLPFLKEIFPDADLVVVSRDLRSTVASISEMWKRDYRLRRRLYYYPPSPDDCYSRVRPTSAKALERERIFPGGRISVLAEKWLNAYETIERHAGLFDRVAVLRHCDLVEAPQRALDSAYRELGLEPLGRPVSVPLEGGRNRRWARLLTTREREDLEAFIAAQRPRIQALRMADIAL